MERCVQKKIHAGCPDRDFAKLGGTTEAALGRQKYKGGRRQAHTPTRRNRTDSRRNGTSQDNERPNELAHAPQYSLSIIQYFHTIYDGGGCGGGGVGRGLLTNTS